MARESNSTAVTRSSPVARWRCPPVTAATSASRISIMLSSCPLAISDHPGARAALPRACSALQRRGEGSSQLSGVVEGVLDALDLLAGLVALPCDDDGVPRLRACRGGGDGRAPVADLH